MKKSIVFAAVALGAISASAQQAIEQPKFFDNWSIGLDGGATTPLKHHAFFGSMRGLVGLHLDKQITPAFAIGAEGQFGVNTSSWKNQTHSSTTFDSSYAGLYGAVDLFNLFGGYTCSKRAFTIEALVGAGWGHSFINHENGADKNYFGTKAGLNFNFNVSEKVTIALKPSVAWSMRQSDKQNSIAFNANQAAFNIQAGVTYHIGGTKFACVQPYNQAEIDALNGQINDLRSALDATSARANAAEAKANGLAKELSDCLNRPAQKEVVKEVNNSQNSVRYVFFRVGSSAITTDQQPNVEQIANYLKNHKDAKVVVKGYASPDGSAEVNERLAKQRAEAVKTSLVNKYKISADRISAEGEGIGNMFSEESWNRVSICTIEESK